MRKLGLFLACLGIGVALHFATAESTPPPVPQAKAVPEVTGRYALTVGQGEAADALTLSVENKPSGQIQLELVELKIKSVATLSPEGRCEARFLIPADADLETPAEVWLLQGRFVFGGDAPYLDGDVRVEAEGRRNAVFRRLSSYYEGPLKP